MARHGCDGEASIADRSTISTAPRSINDCVERSLLGGPAALHDRTVLTNPGRRHGVRCSASGPDPDDGTGREHPFTCHHRAVRRINTATWFAVAGFAALAVAMGIGRFAYTPILPAMIEAGELSPATGGLVASANFAGYLVGALLAAVPAVVAVRRRWLLIALIASAATTASVGLVRGVELFAALRFVGGMASAFVLVFASAIVLERLAAEHRPGLSALHFAGVGVGIALSSLLITALADAGANWSELWLGAGLLAFVGAAAAALAFIREPSVSRRGLPPARPNTKPKLPGLVLAYGLFGFGYVITATFIVVLVRDMEAVRPLGGLVWLLVGLAAVPSVALWTTLGLRFGRRPAFALACLLEAVGVLATVAWQDEPGILVGATLLGGTFMGITALGLAEARSVADDGGRAVALMTAAFGVGQIVGPAFAGILVESTGAFVVPTLAAAAALGVAAFLASGTARIDRSRR